MSRSPGSRSRTCHLISLSATHMHVRHADIPGIPIIPYHLASHHYSHGAPDRSVISSESIFSRILLPVTSGFQVPTLAFRTSQGLPFSLNYRSGQRYSCTPVVNLSPPRPETRAFASVPSRTCRPSFPSFLTTFVRAMPFFTQTYADENRLPILFSQRLSHAGTRSSEDSLAYSTQSGILPAPHH